QSELVEQAYDFASGELTSRFRFRSGETTATVEVLTFCSRSLPTVVLQDVQVRVDRPCRLVITAKVDPTGISGAWRSRETTTPDADKPVVDGSMLWETHGGLSTCGAAYVTRFEGGEDARKTREEHDDLAPLRTTYTLSARAGSTHVVRTAASLIPSQSHSEPDRQATRLAAIAANLGFDRLRQENREAWDDLWRGRINLIGAGRRWQALADAAYFYLHSSAHSSSLF